MAIRSRVRVEYWQNGTMVPKTNAMLYPQGSDIVSTANIDADWTDALWEGLEAAWNAASSVISAAAGNLLSAGLSIWKLEQSLEELRDALSDKAAASSANLNISYPHPLYNSVHIIFEAEDEDDELLRVRAAPAASSPAVQFHTNDDRHHRRAEYVINLDELHAQISVLSGESMFYSDTRQLRPYPVLFAVKEDATITTLSVLHTLTFYFFRQLELAPTIATDITYWMRRPTDEIGTVVAQERLMEYTPVIAAMTFGSGEAVQLMEVKLSSKDRNFVINGMPYNLISIVFRVASRRKYDATRPEIEISGDVLPNNLNILKPLVTQPIPSPAVDEHGQMFISEGIGIASVPPFAPAEVPAGTHQIIFNASQEPGGWVAQQVVRLKQVIQIHPVDPPISATTRIAR